MSDSQRVALVTGASRGIGAAIATALVEAGYFVAGTATSEAGASAISERLGDAGGGLALNVTDAEQCAGVVKRVTDAHGAPAVLVNNAGITRDNLLMRMKDADVAEVLDANLVGAIRMSRLVMRGMMKARFGRIINIGSVVGSSGNAGQANYAASKAGLLGFSRSLAQEIGSRGITVNTVSPGFIDTDMTEALDETTRQQLIDRIALGRLGSAEDVAAVVAFLASPAASYVTGETIHVNGGMYMT